MHTLQIECAKKLFFICNSRLTGHSIFFSLNLATPLLTPGIGHTGATEGPVPSSDLDLGGALVVWIQLALDKNAGRCGLRKLPGRALVSTCSTRRKESLPRLEPHLAWSLQSSGPLSLPAVNAETTHTGETAQVGF